MCGAGSRQGAKAGAGAGAGGRAGYFKDNGMISEMVRNAMIPDTVARRFWTTRTWSQTFREPRVTGARRPDAQRAVHMRNERSVDRSGNAGVALAKRRYGCGGQ